MENFKFTLFSIFILVLVVLAGYWGFSTIESGTAHVENKEKKALQQENEALKKENEELKNQIASLEVQNLGEAGVSEISEVEPTEGSETSNPTVSKHQDLINELQKMINDNVVLKKGSKGTRVGTIQKFLNVYNNTSNRVDNDYGAKTIEALKKFEVEQKLVVTEEIGKNTFQFMINWLEKQ
jgi:hypothetical protein